MMLEVKQIKKGVVIDHIQAGKGLIIFNKLMLNNTERPVVLLMNVDSKKLGKKDIIKIEDTTDVDLTLLSLIDDGITINYIEDGKVVSKSETRIPEIVKGIIKCKNPRCITNSDSYIEPSFEKISKNNLDYKCVYCEEITRYNI